MVLRSKMEALNSRLCRWELFCYVLSDFGRSGANYQELNNLLAACLEKLMILFQDLEKQPSSKKEQIKFMERFYFIAGIHLDFIFASNEEIRRNFTALLNDLSRAFNELKKTDFSSDEKIEKQAQRTGKIIAYFNKQMRDMEEEVAKKKPFFGIKKRSRG